MGSGVIWQLLHRRLGEESGYVTENTDYGIPAAKECEVGLGTKGIDSVTFGVDIGTQDFEGLWSG